MIERNRWRNGELLHQYIRCRSIPVSGIIFVCSPLNDSPDLCPGTVCNLLYCLLWVLVQLLYCTSILPHARGGLGYAVLDSA